MSGRFLIKLAAVHEKSGMSSYAVARATGLNENTVRKYVTEDVYSERIYSHIVTLTDFYKVDWRDPNIIEWVTSVEEPKKYRIKLREAHQLHGLSISQIADKIGVPPSTIREYVETDEVLTDSVPMIVQLLADVYGVSMSDVVQEAGDETPENKAALALEF